MSRKKIMLDQLIKDFQISNKIYIDQVEIITDAQSSGKITPLRKNKSNGMTPPLPIYWWIEEEKEELDINALREEIMGIFIPPMSPTYYLSHPKEYWNYRDYIKEFHQYLRLNGELPKTEVSLRERCFEIWQDEKAEDNGLKGKNGRNIKATTLWKHLGITLEMMKVYFTGIPLPYYAVDRGTPQNILILENEDPYYGLRMLMQKNSTAPRVFGYPISTIIYGGGNAIEARFADIGVCGDEYMTAKENRFFYFGDLDYRGIQIYEELAKKTDITVVPFKEAYLAMLDKVDKTIISVGKKLKKSKKGQIRKTEGSFFSYFDDPDVMNMKKILLDGEYIPQEILSIQDFEGK